MNELQGYECRYFWEPPINLFEFLNKPVNWQEAKEYCYCGNCEMKLENCKCKQNG